MSPRVKKNTKVKLLIPRALRAQVKPWRSTRKREILGAIRKSSGDLVLAATLLGIGKTTIYRACELYEKSK